VSRAVGALVDAAGRRPLIVLALALCALVGTWHFALRVLADPHTDLRELLPTDSPALRAFEHQLGRVGGGATLIVVAESPDRRQNERFVDDLGARLGTTMAEQKASGGPQLIAYVESGSKDVRRFFEDTKWIYADQKDLEQADQTLDRQIAIRSGLVEDLDDDGAPAAPGAPPASTALEPLPPSGAKAAVPAADKPSESSAKKPALGLDEYRDRWKAKAGEHDDFPTGYFETEDGTMIGVRIVSSTTGMGDAGGDTLLGRVQRLVEAMSPTSYHPAMKVGFAGDIPNAAAEKESIVSQAAWASGIAFVLILAGIYLFYRSVWSFAIIALPAFLGVGAAYAFAYFHFGYVNTTGMFLGAIILGNGINYPIVLLSRYREFRARGQEPAEARRESVQNALRAELVGACVASIAYGSLTVTEFRGFNQFGWIGFVGMLLVWISMIPCVPALIAVIERVHPGWLGELGQGPRPVRGGPVSRLVARATERAPWAFLAVAAAVTIAAMWKVPAFLRDPWEYNFDRLGSRGSKEGGAGEWSNKAERVFGGKMNVAGALMLADSAEQVPLLKAQILANDAADPQGRLIADVATAYDLLPGTLAEQQKKLEVLGRIRERLTPAVLHDLPAGERARVEELVPPTTLRPLEPKDLPPLLRRRFEENDGRVGTVFYVKYDNGVSLSDGHNLLRIAKSTDNVRLPDGTIVQTASRSTVFAEMIRSMERDGPRATLTSLLAVAVVVVVATRRLRGSLAVLAALVIGVGWLLGGAAWWGERLNYVNFIALPITFGIGCEYPFNVYDRSRLLGGDVSGAVERVGGAVALCSYTTAVGYSALLFADFQALQSFGRLAVSGEIACLSGALLVLPALLHVLGRRAP
jgi:predicted RND superfamily exporter protein